MYQVQINQANQIVPVTMVNNSGSLLTGLTSPTVQISKAGAAYASCDDGTFTEIGYGDYTVQLSEVDTDTSGLLLLRVKDATSAETKVVCWVGVADAAQRKIITTDSYFR